MTTVRFLEVLTVTVIFSPTARFESVPVMTTELMVGAVPSTAMLLVLAAIPASVRLLPAASLMVPLLVVSAVARAVMPPAVSESPAAMVYSKTSAVVPEPET